MKQKQIQNPLYRYRNFIFIFVIVLLTVIVAIANRDDIELAVSEATSIKLWALLGIIGMSVAYLTLDTIILIVSVDDENLKFGKAFTINAAGAFFSGVTPLYIGSYPSRLYYLYKDGIEVDKSLSALTVKGITYQFLIVVLGLIAFIFEGRTIIQFDGYLILFIIGFIFNLSTILMLILVSASLKINHFVVRLITKAAEKFKFFRKYKEDFIEGVTNYYVKTRRMYQDGRYFFRVFFYTFLKLTVYYGMPIIVFISLGVSVKDIWLQMFAISCLMAIIVSVFPTPGGMAASEAVFLAAFAMIFSSQSTVEAGMLLWRLFSYYLVIVIGLGATLVLQSKEPKPIRKKAKEKQNES